MVIASQYLRGRAEPPVNPWDDYFYWLCLFESLDGYYKSGAAYSEWFDYVELKTAAEVNAEAILYKELAYHLGLFTWDKLRKIRSEICFRNATKQIVYIIAGIRDEDDHIGFKVIDNVLYGTVGNGTTETTLTLLSITAGTSYVLECIFKPATECRFYVDNVDKGAITTNLPSGVGYYAAYPIYVYVRTTEAAAKRFRLSMWEFWQKR